MHNSFSLDSLLNRKDSVLTMRWFNNDQSSEISIHFNDGPVVTNLHPRRSLNARFWLYDTLEYEITLKPNEWGKCFKRYYAPWKIEILDDTDKVITIHNFDLRDKNILVNFDSRSLGDTLAWIPQVDLFARRHPESNVICCQFWPDLGFADVYRNIEFVPPDTQLDEIYATYTIGYFLDDKLANMHPNEPRKLPLAKVAADILAIDYTEQRPLLKAKNATRDIDKKYVCFTMESTAACKHWLYPGGWSHVIDYLKRHDLMPVLIQQKHVEMDGIVNRSGDYPIQQRISELKHCEFFIGLGSGLSWLAWALNKPVVLISGFSAPYTEFEDNCARVINHAVCTECWNDPDYVFDRDDWNWCPRHKNTQRQFECSKSITPQMVINAINSLTFQSTSNK